MTFRDISIDDVARIMYKDYKSTSVAKAFRSVYDDVEENGEQYGLYTNGKNKFQQRCIRLDRVKYKEYLKGLKNYDI